MLAACGPEPKDYSAAEKCRTSGLVQGTPEYAECYEKMKAERLMDEQRQEFEQMKQYDRDWRMRRY